MLGTFLIITGLIKCVGSLTNENKSGSNISTAQIANSNGNTYTYCNCGNVNKSYNHSVRVTQKITYRPRKISAVKRFMCYNCNASAKAEILSSKTDGSVVYRFTCTNCGRTWIKHYC